LPKKEAWPTKQSGSAHVNKHPRGSCWHQPC